MIEINACHFTYPNASAPTLDLAPLHVRPNEHIFLHGKSGSGKSTFLNILCGVLEPQKSAIQILQTDMAQLSPSQKDRFRADNFGIIFQQFNLLAYLSVYDNIALAYAFSRQKALHGSNILHKCDVKSEIKRVTSALELPANLLHKQAMHLSVGEQQRVALARALIGSPRIILADEPTSALDDETKENFMRHLFSQIKAQNSTLIFVSHDKTLASYFDKVYDFSALNGALS